MPDEPIHIANKNTLAELCVNPPAIIGYKNRLIICWVGTDPYVNLIAADFDGSNNIIVDHTTKRTLPYKAKTSPALCIAHNGQLVIGWSISPGEQASPELNLALSDDGFNIVPALTNVNCGPNINGDVSLAATKDFVYATQVGPQGARSLYNYSMQSQGLVPPLQNNYIVVNNPTEPIQSIPFPKDNAYFSMCSTTDRSVLILALIDYTTNDVSICAVLNDKSVTAKTVLPIKSDSVSITSWSSGLYMTTSWEGQWYVHKFDMQNNYNSCVLTHSWQIVGDGKIGRATLGDCQWFGGLIIGWQGGDNPSHVNVGCLPSTWMNLP